MFEMLNYTVIQSHWNFFTESKPNSYLPNVLAGIYVFVILHFFRWLDIFFRREKKLDRNCKCILYFMCRMFFLCLIRSHPDQHFLILGASSMRFGYLEYRQRCTIISIVNVYIEGILPKGPYLPCVSMAGRALLAGYHRYVTTATTTTTTITTSTTATTTVGYSLVFEITAKLWKFFSEYFQENRSRLKGFDCI